VEVTPSMIEAVLQNFPSSNSTAGNELQVRTWLGDVQSIPAYQVRSALLPFISSARCLLCPLPLLSLPFQKKTPADTILMRFVQSGELVLHPECAASHAVHSTSLLAKATHDCVNL
jgi:hypothetical protein